ncbi:MAG TPA: 16S rRNA (adenine(1518)-N(6)/adenine(1519)-N(6))-dimethyltransferase RsmA [Pyrinomonadaceae bacterium]|nr:16S rRNA (adenine(1518)-N(6)/adenine(1519)-N(6))-dimethyltransferase RsmA [Pyrinomonadaceae bacterium]
MKSKAESSSNPIRPSKRFGQHFLHDRNIIGKIISAFDPRQNETVVEIGPGTGALTATLVERAAKVVAIEFDRKLIEPLREKFGERDNFRLIEADALEADICDFIKPSTSARLVANLPYNISTAILQRLIDQPCLPEMVLMLQKEVVDRMLAPAGSSNRGYLSVLVEACCESEKLFDVSPGAFRPPPKVWSTVVRLKRRKTVLRLSDDELFWQLVSAGFAQKRKTILNNLRNSIGPLQQRVKDNGGASIVLCRAEVDVQRRAETLTLNEWSRIVQALT